ncbi:MAG: glycosyltransferase [Candidatus Dojkabacteria bacterium]
MKERNESRKYRVAVVADPLYKYGGAEKHLSDMLKAFPGSVLFTAFCDRDFVKRYFPDIEVRTSFMQYIPGKFKFRYFLNLFQPLAYRLFRFNDFDVILSLSIAFAKYANGKIPHVNICMSPPKFLWEKEGRSLKDGKRLGGINRVLYSIYSLFMNTFVEDIWRWLDRRAAQRIDKMIAISKVVQKRIKKYYKRESDVIYPPVEVKAIQEVTKINKKENWFLYLGRVETYKGVELAIRAAHSARVSLKVAGIGDDLERMKELVKELNAKGYVKFLGFVSEEEKLDLLSKAKALIFPVKGEDFGIVPVEANAAGTPVIAYRGGGVVESISDINPKSGEFFDKYTYQSLAKVLKNFDSRKYKADNCRKQSNNFAVEIFIYKLQRYVDDVVQSC